jgi:hypothetical protein
MSKWIEQIAFESTNGKYMKRYESKQHWDSILPQPEWLSSRKQTTANAGEDVRGKEPLYTVGMNLIQCSDHKHQYGGSSKTINRTTIWSCCTTPGYTFKGM